ncbi:hypothetical protein F2Q68_00019555 [Brassica cretica]|uniref:Uncharacterized protein n=1 Tax=Brassica cretica TaxID=69181 RepID=A0A8S9FQ90_BRACR|nr:hypothetical protein F2Q68_00019555 [Brassica cretica]
MIPRSEHSASSKPPYQQNEDMAPDTALNAAMTEVREVMNNYTNCADPVESAVRKERFRLAEEAGEVVEAATLMLRVPPSNNPQNANPSVLRENMSPNPSRIPTTMRLGPIRKTEEEPVTPPETLPVATKRRPGRPPGRRNVILYPLSFLGVGVRRRTISKTQPSPLKRRIPSTIPRREVNIRKNMKTNGAGPSTIHKGPKREHSRNQIHDAYPEYHARATSHFNSRSQRDNHRNPTPGEDKHRAEREKPIYSGGSRQRSPPLRNREFNLPYSRNERANYYSPRELNETSSVHSREYRRPLNQSSDRTLSDKPLSHHIQKNTSHRQVWVEKPSRPREPAPEMIPRSEHSASSKPPYQQNEDMAPDTALNAAMTEVREVMNNYTNCADPVESAARKERFRLAEEAGEVVEAATLML